jgi:hypothetical protein
MITTRRGLHRSVLTILALLVLIVPTATAGEHEERERATGELREVLEGLEIGIRALRAIDHHEEAERLTAIAKAVARRLEEMGRDRERRDREIDVARHELEVYRIAIHAMREVERPREIEALERLIHALELSIEGHRGEAVRQAWKRAPGREDRIELLLLADKIWRRFENAEKAELCEELARKLQRQQRRRPELRARG